MWIIMCVKLCLIPILLLQGTLASKSHSSGSSSGLLSPSLLSSTGGIRTHILSVMRLVLYRCATTGAQEHGLKITLWELFLLLKEFLASFFVLLLFSRACLSTARNRSCGEKERRRCLNQRFMSPFSFKPWKRSNKGFALIFAFALFQFWVELARAWARKPELIVRLEIIKSPLSSPSKLF